MPFIIEQISGLKKKLDLVKKLVLTPTCKADCVNIIHYTFLSCKWRMEQNEREPGYEGTEPGAAGQRTFWIRAFASSFFSTFP